MSILTLRCVVLLLCCSTIVVAQNETKAGNYSSKKPSPDGTGKVYMGREIAHVMSFEGVSWLERNTRQKEENTNLTIKSLPISQNSIVADVGAGSGYYTFRIARKVTQGRVFAVEIQDDAIQYLTDRSKQLKLNNITVVKGDEKSAGLPENAIDLAIMVDVYHELSYPSEVLQSLKKSLKPKGKLLLIEYKGEEPDVAIKEAHKMTVKQVVKELKVNGYRLIQNGQFLPIQHFLLFEKN